MSQSQLQEAIKNTQEQLTNTTARRAKIEKELSVLSEQEGILLGQLNGLMYAEKLYSAAPEAAKGELAESA